MKLRIVDFNCSLIIMEKDKAMSFPKGVVPHNANFIFCTSKQMKQIIKFIDKLK